MSLAAKDADDGNVIYDAAYGAARRRGLDHASAQDVAAQVALAASLKPEGSIKSPSAWGARAGSNKAIDELRRKQRHAVPTESDDLQQRLTAQPAPDRQVILGMLHAELDDLAELVLSAKQLEAYHALSDAGGSFGDAITLLCTSTGRSRRTIRTHLERALAKLVQEAPDHLRNWDTDQ